MLAAGCQLGPQLRLSPLAPTCGLSVSLGFLTAWWPQDSRKPYQFRAPKASIPKNKARAASPVPTWPLHPCHLCLLIPSRSQACPDSRREDVEPPVHGRNVKALLLMSTGDRDTVVATLGSQTLPRLVLAKGKHLHTDEANTAESRTMTRREELDSNNIVPAPGSIHVRSQILSDL